MLNRHLRAFLKRSYYVSVLLLCLAAVLIATGSIMIHRGSHTAVTYTISKKGNEYLSSELNFSGSVVFEVESVSTNSCGLIPISKTGSVNESNVASYSVPPAPVSNGTFYEYTAPSGSYCFVSYNAKPGHFIWEDRSALNYAYLNMAGGIMIAASLALLASGFLYRRRYRD